MQSGYTILPYFFNKKKGFALGIYTLGLGCGMFLWPITITLLMETYGVSGSILIVSGILLNGCVAARLYLPLPDLSADKEGANEENGKNFFQVWVSVGQKLSDSGKALGSLKLLTFGLGVAIFFTGNTNNHMLSLYYLSYQVRYVVNLFKKMFYLIDKMA